jgi:hypothetical protein
MHAIAVLPSLLAAALLAGCVSVQELPLAPGAGDVLRGRETTLAARDRPDFVAFTPGRAAIGGLIGGALTVDAGNRLIDTHNIEDPSAYIAHNLGAALGERFQTRLVPNPVRVESDDVAALAKGYPQLDLLLDVRTMSWGYIYYPTSWNRYRINYAARLRLIDVKRAQVLAEGLCSRMGDDEANAPTGEELLANGAERLKSELRLAADWCVQYFTSGTFAVGGPPPATQTAAVPAAAGAPAPARAAPRGAIGLPQPGDTWVYRLTEPKRPSGPKQRTYTAKVTAASAGKIVEHYSIEGGPSGESSHGPGSYLADVGYSVLSPYLPAFRDLSAMPTIGRIEVLDPACTGRAVCDLTGRAVGREIVNVPAGSFETVRVKVEHLWRGVVVNAVPPGGRELYIWYAPEVKRAVKFSSRLVAGLYPPIDADFDLELVSYSTSGTAPALAAPAAPAPAAAPARAPAAASDTSVEIVFWESIRASKDPADFRAYLEQYPQGRFAALARNRLAALGAPAAAK